MSMTMAIVVGIVWAACSLGMTVAIQRARWKQPNLLCLLFSLAALGFGLNDLMGAPGHLTACFMLLISGFLALEAFAGDP